MTFKRLIFVFAVLVLAALPALAQDTPTTNSVSFNGVSFQFPASLATNLNIQAFAGDPTDLEQPGGPQVAHTEFTLYSPTEQADSSAVAGLIQVYSTAAFNGYEEASAQLQSLQTLLANRPDLAANQIAAEDNSADLPYMPVTPGAQILRAQAHYVDTPTLSGVAYITAHRLDVSPFTASEFSYTFQGLSADGATYVAAVFPITVNTFPAEIPADFDYDALATGWLDYLTESITSLNSAAPADISPEPAVFDALIQTITFGGMVAEPTPAGEVVTPEPLPTLGGPAPTEDMSGQNPSLGGLAGTWRLVQYGDPNAPTAVIEGSEITLTFETSGISGNAGCNGYGGSFVFEANTLAISGVVSTLMACADDTVTQQESAYLAALGSVTGFQVGDATLQLFYPEGVLVFQAV